MGNFFFRIPPPLLVSILVEVDTKKMSSHPN